MSGKSDNELSGDIDDTPEVVPDALKGDSKLIIQTAPPPIPENVFKPQQGEGPESSSSGDADTGNSSSDESGDNTGDNDK